ncbi:MAG: Patatin-like phospholipase, partial [Variovorax sp.]|nr:Patatin-like phospholipase [Variovorax sp.]
RSPPTGHAEPSVIIRDDAARACAEALTRTAESPTGQPWVVKRLPPSPRAAPGAIEVWLPRTRSPSAS